MKKNLHAKIIHLTNGICHQYALCLLLVFLASCLKTTTEPYEDPNKTVLHPPEWIQGNWTNKRNPKLKLKFTTNEFIVIENNYESSQLGGSFISDVSERNTSSTYTISYKDWNTHWSYHFEKELDSLYKSTYKDSILFVLREPHHR